MLCDYFGDDDLHFFSSSLTAQARPAQALQDISIAIPLNNTEYGRSRWQCGRSSVVIVQVAEARDLGSILHGFQFSFSVCV